jgi:hypothetical protein
LFVYFLGKGVRVNKPCAPLFLIILQGDNYEERVIYRPC